LHDTGANWRYDDTVDDKSQYPTFPGFNCRMSEMTGALMLVQLEKRAAIIDGLINATGKINAALKEIPGVKVRRFNDPEGDTGVSVMFTLETREKAVNVAEALKAEGLDAGTMGDSSVPDWHIYSNWDHILNRQGNNDSGFPFTLSDRKYSKDMCPKTTDLLQRVIHMHISPVFTDDDVDEIINGLKKVLYTLL
jgi:8-amino-3,8-dideoxy-alpha-D-manno-octulosonate transaminase